MRVVVGVSGGIAAYKSCELVSRLVQARHDVRVVMTATAAHFVAPLTFEALSGHAVGIEARDEPEGPLSHVTLAHWAEVMILAPATAALISRLAQGQAQDMLSLVYLGFNGPVLLAPAMEPEMWAHPRTQANAEVLVGDGVHLVGPHLGRMASGHTGLGRMAEPGEIVARLEDVLTPKDLAGVRMLITAGATWEHFDPVRVLTNPSTGLMGVLIANNAVRRGAHVQLVMGPAVMAPIDGRVEQRAVVSAEEMHAVVTSWVEGVDVVIGSAAVSDFRPQGRLAHKAHKEQVGLTWAMERNPDIMQSVGRQWAGKKLLVGFAAETENAIEQAQHKRVKKQLDAVVANRVGDGVGFGAGDYQSWLVTADAVTPLGESKESTAGRLLDWIGHMIRAGS